MLDLPVFGQSGNGNEKRTLSIVTQSASGTSQCSPALFIFIYFYFFIFILFDMIDAGMPTLVIWVPMPSYELLFVIFSGNNG
jgi:hypothetical protein